MYIRYEKIAVKHIEILDGQTKQRLKMAIEKLPFGDIITIKDVLPRGRKMNLRILFEDAYVIVCYKPSGLPTQTANPSAADMVSLLKNYLYKNQKEKKEPYVAVIHRLDQPVEGILVFAKTPFAAKELNKQMQQGNGFGKYYKAVLCGVPREKSGVLEDYLVKDGKTNTSRVCSASEKDAKKAILSYEVLNTFETEGQTRSLVRVKLDTGRHHQIRVQMANMGCPIWGDTKYGVQDGTKKSNGAWQKIALCAYRLEFTHPKTKKQMTFEIEPENFPLPDEELSWG